MQRGKFSPAGAASPTVGLGTIPVEVTVGGWEFLIHRKQEFLPLTDLENKEQQHANKQLIMYAAVTISRKNVSSPTSVLGLKIKTEVLCSSEIRSSFFARTSDFFHFVSQIGLLKMLC